MASGELRQDSREELNRRGGQDESFAGAVLPWDENRELMRILHERRQAPDRLCSQSPVSVAGRHRSQAFELIGHRLSLLSFLLPEFDLRVLHASTQTQ